MSYIANIGLWIQTESKFIVMMTIVGTTVCAIALYALMVWLIPAIVTIAVKKIRRSKFVRRMDRVFYLIRKECSRKTTSGRQIGDERVIQTLNGNLNDSH